MRKNMINRPSETVRTSSKNAKNKKNPSEDRLGYSDIKITLAMVVIKLAEIRPK